MSLCWRVDMGRYHGLSGQLGRLADKCGGVNNLAELLQVSPSTIWRYDKGMNMRKSVKKLYWALCQTYLEEMPEI